MVFVTNFSVSRYLEDIKEMFDQYQGTNINFIFDDFKDGETRWSVPKRAAPGDIAVFMCAKSSRDYLVSATSHIPNEYGQEFLDFVADQKELYKKYSGYIIGCGIVTSSPDHEDDTNWWVSNIERLQQFNTPVSIDDFRSFITISRTGSITILDDSQWNRLKWLVNQKNPGMFAEVIPPDSSVLEKEFENEVYKALSKPIKDLKKAAEKKGSASESSVVQTKVYHRDPIIAAYTKKRAAGKCQLCGADAPFTDGNGEPYLECHHIEWLSNGGMDAIENCVALCPNCHRKMHLVNDEADVVKLKAACK